MSIPLKNAPTIIKIVLVALALSLAAQNAQMIADLDIQVSGWRESVNSIGLYAVSLLAPVFYLCAVWAGADVIARMNEGEGFSPATIKGLRTIGSNLMWGAAAAVLIQPTLSVWIDESFRGVRFDADIASATIGVLGGVLWLVAAQGEKLKSEMDSFI